MTTQWNEQLLQKLKKDARMIVINYNKYYMLDDFYSWAVLKLYQGRKANMTQLFIDYLREELGSETRTPTKHTVISNTSSLEVEVRKDCTVETDLEEFEVLNNLKDKHRAVFILYHQWGMNLKEIGYLFGCSESWASLLLKESNKRLQEKLK